MKQIKIHDYLKVINIQALLGNVVFLVFIFLVLIDYIKIQYENQGIVPESLYINAINYTIPVIKDSSKSENEIYQNKFNYRDFLNKIISIDYKRPELILKRELPGIIIKSDVPLKESDVNIPANVAPFALADNSVIVNTEDQGVPAVSAAVGSVYNPALKNKFNSSKPQVLIYHTHTCESYSPGPDNTLDQTKNICAAGDALSECLNQYYGINVIHDKTIHDENSYLQAYKKSGETLDKYLKKYGDFDLVIDMHRDSIPDKKTVTLNVNGENISTFRFVVARSNPHAANNLNVMNKIISIANKLFPGYCKDTFPYNTGTNYFNQAKSNNAVLIELGSFVSTTEEAKASGKYLGRVIAEYLNSKR